MCNFEAHFGHRYFVIFENTIYHHLYGVQQDILHRFALHGFSASDDQMFQWRTEGYGTKLYYLPAKMSRYHVSSCTGQ